jgi:hypothetical protein
MSYQSRQKKRRYKRVERKAKRTGDTSRRWFLTIAKRPGRFDCCRRTFARGDAIVYRHEPRTIRCQGCAARDPESASARQSLRYDQARRSAA